MTEAPLFSNLVIMMNAINILKLAPDQPLIQDKQEIDRQYKYWRIRTFIGMYVGYAFYYFTRKSFTFAMPAMMVELGFTKAELGILASVLSIMYAFSKFLSGVISDKSNPRFFMGIGLILTGIVNIFFGLSSSLMIFIIFWGLNGWFQGWGWPPCSKLLTHWYSQTERGRWWGMWNTSHNVGGALIPLIAAVCIQFLGWRSALYIPGVLAIGMGVFLIYCLRDTPRSMGLPAVGEWRGDEVRARKEERTSEVTAKDILMKFVLKNRILWVLASAYFFVYILRTALNDWICLYLHEAKGYSMLHAGSGIFWFEIGGFTGSLAAGWISDKIFAGKRGPVNVLFTLGVILIIGAVWMAPAGQLWWVSSLMFMVGFFIFGPQMLIGMAAAELSHHQAAGTATGFVGWFAYLGAAVAGYPLGKISQDWGWDGFFIALMGCGVLAGLLLLPLWAAKSNPEYAS